MSRSQFAILPDISDYIRSVSLREPELLTRLREETAAHPHGRMQISPEQGQFMSLLVRALGVRRAIEIGVFTGYSSIAVAAGMPEDGRLIACDVSEEYTAVARRYWREAGLETKIELRLGPAVETLDALLAGGAAGSFDFAFIDADKENYGVYYERALQLARSGGLILIDNVIWSGRGIDAYVNDADTLAIRAINESPLTDRRVALSMLPIGDGLTLACKL